MEGFFMTEITSDIVVEVSSWPSNIKWPCEHHAFPKKSGRIKVFDHF